jgi:S-adenosylmethionine hydrolase
VKHRGGDATTRRQAGKKVPEVSASACLDAPIVTLLTDFGTADYFVAAVKGVIISANPKVRLIDITHDIPPQDIESAAFTLLAACSAFPEGTIHLAVVDPGVGSERRPLLMQLGKQFFVGPDNGIFSYVCDRHEEPGAKPKFFHITNDKIFRQPVSTTFHGRDIFAPVAAALSLGMKPAALGSEITDCVRLPRLQPAPARDGTLVGRIVHIDRFGNCVTNLRQSDLRARATAARFKLTVNAKSITSLRRHYAEAGKEKVFAIWGSAGFLELATANGSAAKILQVKRGDAVKVIFETP